MTGRQPQAVRRALAVLEAVAAAGIGVTAKEISTELRIPPATTYRLLNLLVAEEYLVRLPDLRGFAVGRRAANLAPASPSIPTAARTVMERLRTRVRWGAHLAGYVGHRIVFLDPDPDHPPADSDALSRHLHATALGQLLLAEHEEYLPDQSLARLTPGTVVDPSTLRRRLAEITDRGFARQSGEFRADYGCMAVPVRAFGDERLIAGVVLTGAAARVAAAGAELSAVLHESASELAPLLA